jgi:type II secretory pathway component PulJ
VRQVRHLLALLIEGHQAEDVNNLIEKVDANHNGEIEFEELATLLRAIDPKLSRNKRIEDIDIQPHPLLEQVRMAVDCLEDGRWSRLMSAADDPPTARAGVCYPR